LFDDPNQEINKFAFSVSRRNGKIGYLIRTENWAYIQYGEEVDADKELYDMNYDPRQYNNLASNPTYLKVLEDMKTRLRLKLGEVRDNDLGINYEK